MITFQNITKTFKTDVFGQAFTALNNVSFEIPEGAMVGFLGANGAGKTTSLKIIMDFIRPTQGHVAFSSVLGTKREEIFRNIGFLPERPYFYPNLTGHEFLHFMGQLSDVSRHEIEAQLKKWAPIFRIDHALNRTLKTYSKGMLQRTGFLAAIIHHPKIIILDEPLSGLDPIGRKEIKDVIVQVHKEGKTVFFSSHIVPDIEEICDRVIFLKEGKLVYDGSVNALMHSAGPQEFIVTVSMPDITILKTPVKDVQYFPDNLKKMKVDLAQKDKLLSEVISKEGHLIGLEVTRRSLEDIFYKREKSHE